MSEFRVLLVYPNLLMMNMVPPAISIFSALLKERGYKVELFDTTYHRTDNEFDSDKKKEKLLQVRPFDLSEHGIDEKKTDVYDDLHEKVKSYSPDLIAVSVVEDTWPLGRKLIEHFKEFNIPTLVGGVFSTFATDIVIQQDGVDFACVGEGEDAIVELSERLSKGKDCTNIPNLWVKKDGKITKNPIGKAVDINSLPMPDFSLFEDKRLYRPMAGKVYRMLPVETQRGCPYTCTFCNSPSQVKLYRSNEGGKFFRKKTTKKIAQEIHFYIERWGIEYVYFTADTFLALNNKEFDEFIEMYSKIKLPFWMQTRPETMTDYRMKKLKEVGIHRMSIGLEHGDEKFRREVIGRRISNEKIIEAFDIADKYNIPVTVNNIVGFPDETRELAQQTVEINTKINMDTTNCYAFTPFHGTPLRSYSVRKGYIKEDTFTGCLTGEPVLEMPSFPKEQIKGIMRTLPMYAKFPRSKWPEIARAEKLDDEGDKVHEALSKEYTGKYFSGESVS